MQGTAACSRLQTTFFWRVRLDVPALLSEVHILQWCRNRQNSTTLLMGSVLSKVSPSAADGAGGSTEGITLDLTPELREEIKVPCPVCGVAPCGSALSNSHRRFRSSPTSTTAKCPSCPSYFRHTRAVLTALPRNSFRASLFCSTRPSTSGCLT